MGPATPLPTGTVTFLFTDIEGSTRLWAEQREAMAVALEAHDAILRAAVERSGGRVVKSTGRLQRIAKIDAKMSRPRIERNRPPDQFDRRLD